MTRRLDPHIKAMRAEADLFVFSSVANSEQRLDPHIKAMRAEERKRSADIRRAMRWEERRTWKAIQRDLRPGQRDYK